MNDIAGMPLTDSADGPAVDGLAVDGLAGFQADGAAEAVCVVCGSPSTTQPTDPRPTISPDVDAAGLPATLPMLQLCDEHWSAYHTDWLLLGWCVDHYAEALRFCEVHQQNVPPL